MTKKASFRYQIKDQGMATLMFYIVIIAIFIVVNLLKFIPGFDLRGNNIMWSNMTAMFLFILGLCSFWEYFHMNIQNGISRQTLFLTRLLSTAVIALLCTIFDFVIGSIVSGESIRETFLFEMFYGGSVPAMNTFQSTTLYLCGLFCAFLLAQCLGYAITIMYYRLSTFGRVAVSVLGGGLIILVSVSEGTGSSNLISNIVRYFSGPLWNILITLVLAVVLSLCAWLMMRRAPVK